MRLVLLGPPGAGKGTQGHPLAERYGVPLISTGDIFRTHLSRGTALGVQAKDYMERGELVPDDVVVWMVVGRLAEPDTENGFILDGFPRTLPQARALDEALEERETPLSAVLVFNVDDEVLVKRLAARRICGDCQRTYNLDLKPPQEEGICDVCGGKLIQRSDDEEETVRRRLDVYHEEAGRLSDYFGEKGLLRKIDADGTVDEVLERAIEAAHT
ncbi:MAG: adenylate kinase [Actinomycetota bacterium]